jgi:hypothetical protein
MTIRSVKQDNEGVTVDYVLIPYYMEHYTPQEMRLSNDEILRLPEVPGGLVKKIEDKPYHYPAEEIFVVERLGVKVGFVFEWYEDQMQNDHETEMHGPYLVAG